ncbi:YdcF family protein [Propionibacteriaceae bacterium Y1685]|uniref:YdcF family protein n=1 Tax=Microlunatus sp. Y1700 TaxID=3418487 RepID=UPI003B779CB3
MINNRHAWIRRAVRVVLGLVVLGLLSVGVLIADGLTDDDPRADVAVVLGNRVDPDGSPSPQLLIRLERALELWRSGDVGAVLVSGATGVEGFDEAQVMADWLIVRGVPAEAVVVDNQGWTTRDTARHAAAVMAERGWTRAIVVSQYFHVPRCKLALRQGGVTDVGGVHARGFLLRDFYSVPREVIGYASYLFGGD